MHSQRHPKNNQGKRPGVYRTLRPPKATALAKFKKNAGGGKCKGTIIGPMSSIGTCPKDSKVAPGNGNDPAGNIKV